MRYAYIALDARGQRHKGERCAHDREALERHLHRQGMELLRATPRHPFPWLPQISRQEKINLCLQLQHLLQAGIPLFEALEELQAGLPPSLLQHTLQQLRHDLERGLTLSQALQQSPLFSHAGVGLIQAGEQSGQLAEVLGKLAATLKWEDELVAHTRKLLLYPTLVALVVGGATLFLMLYLVPQLKPFISNLGHALPFHTQLLFLAAELLARHGDILLLGLPVALASLALLRRQPFLQTHWDRSILRLPLLGNSLKKIALSHFARNLAMLYGAGIPLLEALRATRETLGNQVIRQALAEAETAVRQGSDLASAFHDAAVFPPLVIRMLRVGERSGALEASLGHISYFYDREVQESIARAQILIEPLLTLLLGLLLGWVMLAILAPLYDATSQMHF